MSGLLKMDFKNRKNSELRPLGTTQEVLTWLSVCRASENTTKLFKSFCFCFTSIVLMSELFGLTSAVINCVQLFSNNLDDFFYSLFHVLGHSLGVFSLIYGLFSRQKITSLLEQLTEIYNASKTKNMIYLFKN